MLLNVQTSYSLLQSTLRIDQYIQKAKHFGYTSLGIADKNVLHGVVEFYQACLKENISPLIGMTLSTKGIIKQENTYSMLLYAKNFQGYQELIELSKILSQTNLSQNAIWQYLKTETCNLVMISSGIDSELEESILQNDSNTAIKIIGLWREIFGEANVYLGISAYPYHPKEVELLSKFANELGLTMVINQKVNLLDSNELFSLKVLEAIDKNETIELSLREMQGTYYLYPYHEIKSMYELAGIANVVEHTLTLAEQLSFELPLDQAFLPKFKVPPGETADSYLKKLIDKALEQRNLHKDEQYLQRANYELSIISQMGFSDYFLIVWEIMDFCKQNKIRVGPGRGSAAGALISYLLNITFVDPIQYDLLFERFLNPERYNMPDIDLDIPDNKRDLVLKHIESYYGHEQVAQIGTMGTLGAKQAIRDTLRVLGFSTEIMGQWARAIPRELNINLEKAFRLSAKLRELVQANEQNKAIFQVATTIEGLPRHLSTHAAGIIIHDAPLATIIPVLERPQQMPLSQLTMYGVEKVGLLKLDILGLRNLSLLDDILQNINRITGELLDVYQFPIDDEATLALFREADTNGVFQFESDGIKNVLKQLGPTEFEDIVAVNALFRPGPMQQIDEYIKRKKQLKEVTYLSPNLEPILKSTYGIIIYQEQVMQICQQLAGFTLGQADILRRAMAKKQADTMEKERIHFVEGARKKGIDSNTANQIYAYIDAFASYGFNRSHAVVYSTLAYQLAYLKAHYPLAFYQAILNQGRSNLNSFIDYVEEAKRRLGKLLPLNINRSQEGVVIDGETLRIGFDSVKGIRKDFISYIINDRTNNGLYPDLLTFLARLPKKYLKQENIENLIKAGAFDGFGYNRATLYHNLPKFIQSIEFSGLNLSLFQDLEPKVEPKEEWSQAKIVVEEKEVLGFTLAPHPLEAYHSIMSKMDDMDQMNQFKMKQKIKSLVYIQEIRVIETKKGDLMAFLTADTGKNTLSLVVFPAVYLRRSSIIKPQSILYMEGMIDRSQRGEIQIVVNHLEKVEEKFSIDNTESKYTKCFIRLTDDYDAKAAVKTVEEISRVNPGPCSVIFVTQSKLTWQMDDEFRIGYGNLVQNELKTRFGDQNVVFK